MINFSASLLGVTTMASSLCSCSSQQKESPMQAKVEEYASVELKSDIVNNLSDKEKELVRIFFQVGKITDDLFWKQTFGDKSLLDTVWIITSLAWLVMVRNRMYATITRWILPKRSLMLLKMKTRTHGTRLSAATKMVL